MKPEHAEWIKANVVGNGRGTCAEATTAMAAAFPTLKRVRGQYLDWVIGPRDHWWLVDLDGTIVDPTATQFPTGGSGDYQPRDESLPEPTGRCMECGELCFDHRSFCSDDCEVAGVAYYNSLLR